MKTRVLLADDHRILREGVAALLDKAGYEVVADAGDGLQAVKRARRHRPDIAILDLAMPRLNGIDAAREIGRVAPKTRSIMLTRHSEDRYVLEALRAGVSAYVLKTRPFAELKHAIEQTTENRLYLSPGLSDHLVQTYLARSEPPEATLTPRERQILQLVAEGYTTKQIASQLSLSVKTVESHRSRIMQKLKIHDTVGLVHYAIRCGLVHI